MDAPDLASAVNMPGDQVSNFPAESSDMFTAGMNPPVPLYNFETISNRGFVGKMQIRDLLRKMVPEGASDLFMSAGRSPFYRIRTKIVPSGGEAATSEEISAFRKQVLTLKQEERFLEGGDIDAGLTLDAGMRFRINFYLQQGVPGLVARLVPSGNYSMSELNLPPAVAKFADLPRGLVLIAGPAGSGKSTTMAAILNHINRNYSRHIVTIEDPIEFVHRDVKSFITQREVGSDTMTFGSALKHVVRESPDAIFIGEMRDQETMQTAITTALTGHLVVSTVHTTNAVQCVERIVNQFPEHMRTQMAADLAMALEGIAVQKLVPTADGKGVVPAVEILKSSPLVRRVISDRNFGELEDVIRRGFEEGMQTFSRALADLHKAGRITLEDGAAAAVNKDEFQLLAQGMESGIETFRDLISDDEDAMELNMKRLLHSAVANGASDLILTVGSSPCLRVNGNIVQLDADRLTPSDTKRLLFSVVNSKQREVFEEKREIDFALSVNVKRSRDEGQIVPYRFRINGFYQRGNVAIAARVIPRAIPTPEELGLPTSLVKLVQRHQGLILITGPTGHGKSTTMAALINRVNSTRPCHIITIEDPIEYVHANKMAVVEQREVFADTLSFANALKYVLRQDPDVILVGEMRDPETIGAALTAAETGHLVIATLHTNSAAQSIDRIIDSFPSYQQNQIKIQLSGSILGIASQRLLPRKDGRGRVAVFEIMLGNSAIKNLIREGKTHLAPTVIETCAKEGMITLDKALQELYERDVIRRQDALVHMTSAQARE